MIAELDLLMAGETLTEIQSRNVFNSIIAGKMSEIEITALLVALRMKKEAPTEIAGAAQAIRAAATPLNLPNKKLADSCGTGGDGLKTINISTAAAFLAAACGIPMVKHGNRSVSSKSGSADVLEALGVQIEHPVAVAERCLNELDICFLFAPAYHPGIRHVMPVRRALKTRTIFNLLGPLVNPAKPEIQLMGVYDPLLCRPIAETLGLLGCQRAMVVHGSGLDEIALHGSTHVAELRDGEVEEYALTPRDFGTETMAIDEIVGGNAEQNAESIRQVLRGRGMLAHQMVIAINVAALLRTYGSVDSFREGMDRALATLHSGVAYEKLTALADMTQS